MESLGGAAAHVQMLDGDEVRDGLDTESISRTLRFRLAGTSSKRSEETCE